LFDHHKKKGDKPPHPSPAFPLPADCWDGRHLVYDAEVGTQTHTMRVSIETGKGERLAPVKKNAEKVSTVAERLERWRQLTPAGDLFLRERKLAQAEVVTWKEKDGTQLEGILTRPADGSKQPYRLVVHLHGGPHSRSALGFDFTVQILAANGYAVFQPNFRGSSGYGQKIIDAHRYDLGGRRKEERRPRVD